MLYDRNGVGCHEYFYFDLFIFRGRVGNNFYLLVSFCENGINHFSFSNYRYYGNNYSNLFSLREF